MIPIVGCVMRVEKFYVVINVLVCFIFSVVELAHLLMMMMSGCVLYVRLMIFIVIGLLIIIFIIHWQNISRKPKRSRPSGLRELLLLAVKRMMFPGVMNIIYLSIYSSIYPSIHPSIHLSMIHSFVHSFFCALSKLDWDISKKCSRGYYWAL